MHTRLDYEYGKINIHTCMRMGQQKWTKWAQTTPNH